MSRLDIFSFFAVGSITIHPSSDPAKTRSLRFLSGTCAWIFKPVGQYYWEDTEDIYFLQVPTIPEWI